MLKPKNISSIGQTNTFDFECEKCGLSGSITSFKSDEKTPELYNIENGDLPDFKCPKCLMQLNTEINRDGIKS